MIIQYEIIKADKSVSVYAVNDDGSWSLSAVVEDDFTLEQLAQEFYEMLAIIGNHPITVREV